MRRFIDLVENTAAPTASRDDVAELVAGIHHRQEDLADGDLLHRIERFVTYVLRPLPIADLNLGEWLHDEDTSDDYAARMLRGEVPPPIVFDAVDGSIIDGTHRANAAAKAGHDAIMAYVGLPENIDPSWSDNPDEIDEGVAPDKTFSPAFRRWFKNSKVVDEQGQPLVVYHGTGNNFSAFDLDHQDGLYFSDSSVIAHEYASRFDDSAPNIIAAYLSMQNPLNVDYRKHLASLYSEDQEVSDEDLRGEFASEVVGEIIDMARERGHDGVILRGIRDGWRNNSPLANTYVVFRPEQVKSIFNRGTFDPKTARISEAEGDRFSPAFRRWFGQSKVVDEHGNPLVLHHGTAHEFESFRGMVWGSTTPKLAGEYAEFRALSRYDGGANVVPIYLRVERPFDADRLRNTITLGVFTRALAEQATEQGRALTDATRQRLLELAEVVERARRREESGPHYGRHEFWFETEGRFGRDGAAAIREMFDLLGFDGITMIEHGERTFGAFTSAQAKSAWNKGTWNPDDPRISEARAERLGESLDARNTYPVRWIRTPEDALSVAKRHIRSPNLVDGKPIVRSVTETATAEFDADGGRGEIKVDIQYVPAGPQLQWGKLVDVARSSIIVQDFRFAIDGSYVATGAQGSTKSKKIYATAVNCLIDVARAIRPDMIVIRSNEAKKEGLYDRIAQRVPGYTFTDKLRSRDGYRHVMTRNDRLVHE